MTRKVGTSLSKVRCTKIFTGAQPPCGGRRLGWSVRHSANAVKDRRTTCLVTNYRTRSGGDSRSGRASAEATEWRARADHSWGGLAGPHHMWWRRRRSFPASCAVMRGGRRLLRRVPCVAEAVLGTASVGAGLLLRKRRRGGRKNDPRIYRESTVGRGHRRIQGHRADRALSRRGSRAASGGLSRNPTFSR